MQYADLLEVPDLLATYRASVASDNTTYLVSPELRILRTNPAWTRFARSNGGTQMIERWGRGSSLLDAIPEVLREFYRTRFLGTLATGQRWEHDYECSSAEAYRQFRMLVIPIRTTFLVVTHALRIARGHDRVAHAADVDSYEQHGILKMCSSCRRVEVPARLPARWDWVPELVAHMPPNTSHGLCPPCATLYL